MTVNMDISTLSLAIDNYEYYTKTQRAILKIIAKTSIDGECKVGSIFIAQQLNISRTSVYKAIQKFTREQNLSVKKGSKTKHGIIILNAKSMQTIIDLYKAKQRIQNSNKHIS